MQFPPQLGSRVAPVQIHASPERQLKTGKSVSWKPGRLLVVDLPIHRLAHLPIHQFTNSQASPLERFRPRGRRQPGQIPIRVRPEPLPELCQRVRAAVADRRAQVLEHVVDHRADRPARRHADLEPFGARALRARAGSASSRSSRSRTAPIDAMPRNTLNGTCTIFCDSGISTGFSTISPGVSCGAGERAAQHHRVAAEEQRLRRCAVAPDAAVGDERHALADRDAGTARAPRPAGCRSWSSAASCSRRPARCRP